MALSAEMWWCVVVLRTVRVWRARVGVREWQAWKRGIKKQELENEDISKEKERLAMRRESRRQKRRETRNGIVGKDGDPDKMGGRASYISWGTFSFRSRQGPALLPRCS